MNNANLTNKNHGSILNSMYLKQVYDEAFSTDYEGKTKLTTELRQANQTLKLKPNQSQNLISISSNSQLGQTGYSSSGINNMKSQGVQSAQGLQKFNQISSKSLQQNDSLQPNITNLRAQTTNQGKRKRVIITMNKQALNSVQNTTGVPSVSKKTKEDVEFDPLLLKIPDLAFYKTSKAIKNSPPEKKSENALINYMKQQPLQLQTNNQNIKQNYTPQQMQKRPSGFSNQSIGPNEESYLTNNKIRGAMGVDSQHGKGHSSLNIVESIQQNNQSSSKNLFNQLKHISNMGVTRPQTTTNNPDFPKKRFNFHQRNDSVNSVEGGQSQLLLSDYDDNQVVAMSNLGPNQQDMQSYKESLAEKEVKIIKKNFVKLHDLCEDDKITIEKQKQQIVYLKQQYQDLQKTHRNLIEEHRRLRFNYTVELSEKKRLEQEVSKISEHNSANERKILQLQQYISDCEKQIIKISSENLEVKMKEEQMRNDVGAVRQNYENTILHLNDQISQLNENHKNILSDKDFEIHNRDTLLTNKTKEYEDLLAKFTVYDEMINNAKGFKPGTTEFDKMQARINRLENDVDLYKKVIQKMERDQKKKEEDWLLVKQQHETNEVNLLAELRTVKESTQKREEQLLYEIKEVQEQFTESRQDQGNLQEHIEFITNELKLVKEVNTTFRSENQRLISQYTDLARQYDDMKMNQFKINETNIKMKKEVAKLTKDLGQAREDKDVAENEYLVKMQEIAEIKSGSFSGSIHGMTAFQLISEEAKEASQSEFKKLLHDQTVKLAQEKQKQAEMLQQQEDQVKKYDEINQQKFALELEKQELQRNVQNQSLDIQRRNNFITEMKENIEGGNSYLFKIAEIMQCLSCLTHIERPLMLSCGHSLCRDCVTKHLHPFKKDSMVLCEKCTVSTVAKNLKNSIVLDDLSFCFYEILKTLKKNALIFETKGTDFNITDENQKVQKYNLLIMNSIK